MGIIKYIKIQKHRTYKHITAIKERNSSIAITMPATTPSPRPSEIDHANAGF